jgi:hypothetical protein
MNAVTPGAVDPVAHESTQPVSEYGTDHIIESVSDANVSTGITPEIVAVIEAAATAFVGKKIRILSVRILSESEQDSSTWADKGRDIIHASHNLVQRGH